MSPTDPIDRLVREVRVLKMYALVSTIVLGALLVSAFGAEPTRFEEISTERLRILNPDGKHALVIAGQGLLPGPTFEGREYPQELSGGRTRASGMIFFNERGDEVGGLTYSGDLQGDGYRAGGGITFDQFRQDQVVSLQYSDDGTRRSAGVQVWDRSTEIGLDRILELADARSRATGAARDSIDAIIQGLASQGLAASRVFLGSQNRNAMLVLRDAQSRPRMRLVVDSANVARMEMLDSAGVVTRTWPD